MADSWLQFNHWHILGGLLGDEFSNKKLLVISMSWYSLWSLVADLSVYSSHVLFGFACVFQGMGPALTLPKGLASLTRPDRPKTCLLHGLVDQPLLALLLVSYSEASLLSLGGRGFTGARRLLLLV